LEDAADDFGSDGEEEFVAVIEANLERNASRGHLQGPTPPPELHVRRQQRRWWRRRNLTATGHDGPLPEPLLPVPEGTECIICFSNPATWVCPVNPGAHAACTDCISRHTEARVSEGLIFVSCPCGYHECNHRLAAAHVRAVATPAAAAALDGIIARTRSDGGGGGGAAAVAAAEGRESVYHRVKSWWWRTRKTWRCSQCRNYIQKDGGCNHMTCRCGHEICWCCGADWVRKGTRGHTQGLFPGRSDWGTACHSKKIWAQRTAALTVGLPLGTAALGIAVGVGVPTAMVYGGYKLCRLPFDRKAERRRRREWERERLERQDARADAHARWGGSSRPFAAEVAELSRCVACDAQPAGGGDTFPAFQRCNHGRRLCTACGSESTTCALCAIRTAARGDGGGGCRLARRSRSLSTPPPALQHHPTPTPLPP
jgi:hypothetical protein